jgi:hypothetical protein
LTHELIEIPTLPVDLRAVPNGKEWFIWRERITSLSNVTRDLCQNGDGILSAEDFQQLEMALCSADPARWIAFWLYIEEPRIRKDELPIKPFVPFAFQVELAQWFAEKTALEEAYDGFVSKSRGLGASWIFAALAAWAWLFRPWRGTLISRKEDLVDRKGDLNSLFGKIDFILDHLPQWMLPPGYDVNKHRLKNLLQHPTSNAALVGEATTSKATRGSRATFIIYDEAAFIPDFRDVFATGSGTTFHRWAVSSESFEEGDAWWLMWTGARDEDPGTVRELPFTLNPYFDEHWEADERLRFEKIGDPHGFAREYLRDPHQGGTWIYPVVRSIKTWDDMHYDPDEIVLVGIDPGRADDTAIVWMQFDGPAEPRTSRWIDSYSNNLQPAEYYAHILTGITPDSEDPMYHASFDSYATDHIMPWMYSLPWSGVMRVFSDPAGGNKSITDNLSFVDRITLASKRLREREAKRYPDRFGNRRVVGIVPLYEELFSAGQKHPVRHNALRELLMLSSFSETRGAKKLKYALENYRYSEPGNKSTSEPAPLHDVHSHLSSAAEYIACYCRLGLGRQKSRRETQSQTAIDPFTGRKIKFRK